MDVIKVDKLTKQFGDLKAVNNVSFTVSEGEIFGLLGPNGAGKTTTIKMLITVLRPTSGRGSVAGYNIKDEPNEVRGEIGIIFQDPSLDDELTGRENLEFHAILYRLPRTIIKKRISEVLKLVELKDKADMFVKNYSGGMKRRLEIGRGLMHHPKVLFLDEPTIGLDPQTRRHMWDYIMKLSKQHKTTIILTTHYIEEADYLCNRVAIMDHGSLVAMGTPSVLKNKLGGDIVSLELGGDVARAEKIFKRPAWVKSAARHENFLDLTVENGEKLTPEIVVMAEKHKIAIKSVSLHQPSLEDVFIHYTGKSIREEESSAKDRMRVMRRMWGRR
jgi:ABC-2 type transport system ATP-binding protein